MLSKFNSPDTDAAGLDLSSECPAGSLVCSGSGDNPGLREEKPRCLLLNVVGSVPVLIAEKQINIGVARTFVTTSDYYQITACTCVRYWAGYQ